MWDLKCLAAAACFLASNILFIVHGARMMVEHNSDAHAGSANDGNVDQNIYDSNNPYDTAKENDPVKPMNFHFQYWKDLDPTYIESRWEDRAQQRPIMMSAALLGAAAWFWFMVPIVQSAWVLSRGGRRKAGAHVALAGLAICGGIIEMLARLMIVGMTNASQWMARDFNMDDWDTVGDGTGWRVLEMIHIVTTGMLLWIDTFEALALFGIVTVMFYSITTEPKFRTVQSSSQNVVVETENEDGLDIASGSSPEVAGDTNYSNASPPQSAFAEVTTRVTVKPTFTKCFAWYGLFVGLLAVVDFIADVLRFIDWKLFGKIAMATNVLLGVIFLPIWLLCLARQLPGATERFEREERRASVLLNAGGDETAALKGNERMIS